MLGCHTDTAGYTTRTHATGRQAHRPRDPVPARRAGCSSQPCSALESRAAHGAGDMTLAGPGAQDVTAERGHRSAPPAAEDAESGSAGLARLRGGAAAPRASPTPRGAAARPAPAATPHAGAADGSAAALATARPGATPQSVRSRCALPDLYCCRVLILICNHVLGATRYISLYYYSFAS